MFYGVVTEYLSPLVPAHPCPRFISLYICAIVLFCHWAFISEDLLKFGTAFDIDIMKR